MMIGLVQAYSRGVLGLRASLRRMCLSGATTRVELDGHDSARLSWTHVRSSVPEGGSRHGDDTVYKVEYSQKDGPYNMQLVAPVDDSASVRLQALSGGALYSYTVRKSQENGPFEEYASGAFDLSGKVCIRL